MTILKLLKLHSTGPNVRRVQRRLRANGYSAPLSGVYCDDTAAAVREFQAAHVDSRRRPLRVDGWVAVGGRQTWWALAYANRGEQEQPDAPDADEARRLALRVEPLAVRQLLWIAAREVGVREDPDGSNGGPVVDVYTDRRRVPWCALFVSRCLRQARGGKPAFPPHHGIASVPRIARWASEHGCAIKEPRWPATRRYPDILDGAIDEPAPGDVFLMLLPDGDGVDAGRGHCGFVLAVEPRRVLTIAGNESNAVRCRWRQRSTIAGYARVIRSEERTT